MKRLLARLLPRRIASQTTAVVLASMVLLHLALTAQFFFIEMRRERQERDFVHAGTLVRLIAESPAGEARRRVVADAARAFPTLELDLTSTPPRGLPPNVSGPGEDRWRFPPFDNLGPEVRVVDLMPPDRGEAPPDPRGSPPGAPGPGGAISWLARTPPGPGGPPRFAIALPGGDWLTLVDRPPQRPFFFGPWGVSFVFVGLASALLGLWALWGLVGPLRALAAAARDFDIEGEAEPLPKRGPEEVRIAATAFEAMRRRIRALVEDRTRMLAAMGHDLRTPLTRMRLRSEFVADPALRAEFQRDLAGMNEMIDGALTYLAEGRHREAPALVDLPATIQTVLDGWSDQGRDVAYEGPGHLSRRVRPMAIERAIANLVDNALKYGGRCVVRLEATAEETVISVVDDGPGIAVRDREAMLKPFVRGDAARNMDDHRGFGLGLAIVKAVVDGHGGRLEFETVEPQGLEVRMILPRLD